MNETKNIKIGGGREGYERAFKEFEKAVEIPNVAWLREIRENAVARFSKAGFPTKKGEDWRYTDVGPIAETPFEINLAPDADSLSLEKLTPFLFSADWPRLVFLNGRYSEKLSMLNQLAGKIECVSLAEAMRANHPVLKEHLGRYLNPDFDAFPAINTALIRDGALVYIRDHQKIEQPLHVISVTGAREGNMADVLRHLIVIGEQSEASLLESYIDLSDQPVFSNVVSEVRLGAESKLEYCKIIRESDRAFWVGNTAVWQGRASSLDAHMIALGGKMVRNQLYVDLHEEEAGCVLDGLYLASDGNHIDHHVLVDHPRPRGTSRQLFKGILEGKSQAIFNGKIRVHRDAQKTDAVQINKNLLLSEGAVADTRPQLQIDADDVKCSHGAAVGQLDEAMVFYLKSRGMSDCRARNLLTYGFASEVINRIPLEAIRRELDRLMLAKFENKE